MAKQVLHSENTRVDFTNSTTSRQFADEFFKDPQCRGDFMRPLYRQVFANCLKEFGDTDYAIRLLGPYLGEFLSDVFYEFTCDVHGSEVTYRVFTHTLYTKMRCYAAIMTDIFVFLSHYAKDYVFQRNTSEQLPF